MYNRVQQCGRIYCPYMYTGYYKRIHFRACVCVYTKLSIATVTVQSNSSHVWKQLIARFQSLAWLQTQLNAIYKSMQQVCMCVCVYARENVREFCLFRPKLQLNLAIIALSLFCNQPATIRIFIRLLYNTLFHCIKICTFDVAVAAVVVCMLIYFLICVEYVSAIGSMNLMVHFDI